MTDSMQSPGGLKAPRRNHFFFGKMMGVAQFEQEQTYDVGQRRLMNRLSLGSGILCGLQIQKSGATGIAVQSGAAVDALGREIVVPLCAQYDIANPPADSRCGAQQPVTTPGKYLLCLSYCECGADAKAIEQSGGCSGQPDCDYDTTVETFSLNLKPVDDNSTPSPFDCDQWMADEIVSAPVEGEGPGSPDRPPTIDELRSRAAEMLNSDCPTPLNEACVVLGQLNVGRNESGGLFIDNLDPSGRAYLYSQAQLFDMILCLAGKVAACCEEKPVEPPPTSDTLRVTNVELVQIIERRPPLSHIDPGFVRFVHQTLSPLPESDPPTFVLNGAKEDESSTLRLRVTFNLPIDGSSLPNPLDLSTSPSVIVTGDSEAALTTVSIMDSANAIWVWCSDPGLSQPGTYTLTIFGGDDPASPPAHVALRSWASDPTKERPLDGAPSTTPSGDGTDGGDFTYMFKVEAASQPQLETMRLVSVGIQYAEYPPQWQNNVADLKVLHPAPFAWRLILKFNQLPIEDDWTRGIIVQSGSVSIPATRCLDALHEGAIDLFFNMPEDGSPVEITLLAAKLRSTVDHRDFDGDPNIVDPLSLPTGDKRPGGDFTFIVTAQVDF